MSFQRDLSVYLRIYLRIYIYKKTKQAHWGAKDESRELRKRPLWYHDDVHNPLPKRKLGRHKLSTYTGTLDTVAPCLDTPTSGEKIGKWPSTP
jgi:hypothetical protein